MLAWVDEAVLAADPCKATLTPHSYRVKQAAGNLARMDPENDTGWNKEARFTRRFDSSLSHALYSSLPFH